MGGSDKILIELAKEWIKSGNEVKILGCGEAGKMCFNAGLGEYFQQISNFEVEKWGLLLSYGVRTLLAFFAGLRVKSGMIYSSSDFFPDLVYGFWQKILNKKLRWVSGLFLIAPKPLKSNYSNNIRGWLYFLFKRLALIIMRFKSDLIVVLCDEDKLFLEKMGIQKKKILTISGGVDWEIINKTPRQKIKYEAIFVGRFHQQKGLFQLISAWKLVVKKMPLARLAIVGWGDPTWIKKINFLIKKYCVSKNTDLLGFLDNKEKYRAIKSSKIFLFPSLYESWGIVVAEAMACGRPVVSFDMKVMKKFGGGVIKVEYANVQKFAEAVLNLLRNKKILESVSREGFLISKKFLWENSANKIIRSKWSL